MSSLVRLQSALTVTNSLRMQCKNGQMWALVVKAISGTLPNETCVFAPFSFPNVVASSRFPCGYLCTFLCLHLVCRAFRNTGRCRYGDECNYEHSEGDPIEPPPRGQCFNWKQTGECDYGDNCRFLHGDDDDGSRFKKKEVRSTQCCSRTGSSYSCSVARALGASVLWYLAIRFVY